VDWISTLGDVNYLAVILATVSTLVVGFLWYAEWSFGKTWMGHVGLTENDIGNPNPLTYLWTLIGSFLAALALAALMGATGTGTAVGGLVFGIIAGLAFRVTAHVMHNGFARRSGELTLIDGLHDVVQTGVMGLIIGLFG
jgi:hypothetical protein